MLLLLAFSGLIAPAGTEADTFYKGHPWCERPIISGAARGAAYRYNEQPPHRVTNHRSRSVDALRFLLHQADVGNQPVPSQSKALHYQLQAAFDYHAGSFTNTRQSPFVSVTTSRQHAEGFAQQWASRHQAPPGPFPGEVLVIEVPANYVCDRQQWKSLIAKSGRRVFEPDDPIFQQCLVFQTDNTVEAEWVFVHEIPAEYVQSSYPYPDLGEQFKHGCDGEQDQPPSGKRSKLRGKQANAAQTRASSTSPKPKTVTFGGVTINLDTLYATVLEYLKKQFQAALQAKLEQVQGEFEDTARGYAQDLYQDFLYWLNENVHAEIGSHFPVDSQEFEQEFLAWLNSPGERLRTSIENHLKERSATVAWLINAYQDQASWEIVGGLQGIWSDAKTKLDRFARASEAVVSAPPNTPYADILEKYGFSGPWIDGFKSYEGQFTTFNDRFKIVQAGGIIVGAFQSDVPRDKINSLFQLLELMGRVAEDSRIPIVSFFGEIVRVYGEVAKEMLAKIDGLAAQLRARQGYCLGVGTTADERNDVYRKMFGDHTLICPTRLSPDIYERTEPNDGRIYFWVKDKFVEGQELGGGLQGVRETIALIEAAATVEYPNPEQYRGKEKDVGTIAQVYNTPYQNEEYGNGIPGLRKEAEATIDGIAERLKALEGGIGTVGDKACKLENLYDYLKRETGLEAAGSFADAAPKLKVFYAISYVEKRGGAYSAYSNVWQKLKPLSLIRLSGQVRQADKLSLPCPRCGGATLDFTLDRAGQLTGCEVQTADASGDFVAHLVTNSTDFLVRVSAKAEGKESDALKIDRQVIGVDAVPFVELFSMTLPVLLEDGEVVVPDLAVFDSVGEIKAVLQHAGLTGAFEAASEPPPSKEKEFKVQSQTPAPDTKVKRGTTVTVAIYQKFADEEVVVPNVAALEATQAEGALQQAGLTPEMVAADEPPPDKEKEFTVQSQAPAPDTKVKRGTTVTVAIYQKFDSADEDVVVPNLAVFDSVGEIKAVLQHAGLTGAFAAASEPPPSKEKEFKVQSQAPAPDTKVKRGTTVTVAIYQKFDGADEKRGADEGVVVPNLAVFDSVGEIKAVLQHAGLTPAFVAASEPPPSKEKEFKVQGQTPAPDTKVERGTTVTVAKHIGINSAV
jgi:beta-lactam-binding protein with PASTA domain